MKFSGDDKGKTKKYVGDAAEKLLRLNLTVPEKVSLAKVMQLAGLDKQAAKIEDVLLKKQRTSPNGSLNRIGRNVNLNAYVRIEQMFKKNRKGAINLAQREYRRLFRIIYGVFSGGQIHNYYNIHQITRLTQLIKRFNSEKDFLGVLKTTSSSPLIKQCEYAFACEQFGQIEDAQKGIPENSEEATKKIGLRRSVYGMMLINNNYSAAAPVLKKIQLEDLVIVSSSIYKFFQKAGVGFKFLRLVDYQNESGEEFYQHTGW